ncbi:MAG TPA: dienelactone hydrolase family protein, partial [Puia sp.]|nr:dienelactone hydrolase family protein [Puia sp.]
MSHNIKKDDIRQEVFDLYDDYAHSRINRRDFMEKLSTYAAGSLTVPALMSYMMPDYANTLQVRLDDPRIKSDYVYYDSPNAGGKIKALLSEPVDHPKKVGGVVVVHENRGLNPYIEDVGRRLALAGFLSIAPDALTPLGGYPGNDDQGREMQAKRDKNDMLQNFIDGFNFLRHHPDCNGK